MSGNWTDRNVAEFLGPPGTCFGKSSEEDADDARSYVREMLRVLAEQTPPQLSLQPNHRVAFEAPYGVQRDEGEWLAAQWK